MQNIAVNFLLGGVSFFGWVGSSGESIGGIPHPTPRTSMDKSTCMLRRVMSIGGHGLEAQGGERGRSVKGKSSFQVQKGRTAFYCRGGGD